MGLALELELELELGLELELELELEPGLELGSMERSSVGQGLVLELGQG